MATGSGQRVVVLGAGGQLGREVVAVLAARGAQVSAYTRQDLDIRDPEAVRAVLARHGVDVVMNAAAATAVDACEEKVADAFAVNAVAVRHVAAACREHDALLVHFSTDYVFDGRADGPYPEDAPPNPQSIYGISKLAGEFIVRANVRRHLIIRTSGLYGRGGARAKGGNFVETMLRLGPGGGPIRVVADQRLSPTAARDLAHAVVDIIGREHTVEPARYYGVYHLTNAGSCTWYEFAQAIFAIAGMKPLLQAISSEEWGAPAPRPAYSVLANKHATEVGLKPLRPWKEALAAYLTDRGSG